MLDVFNSIFFVPFLCPPCIRYIGHNMKYHQKCIGLKKSSKK